MAHSFRCKACGHLHHSDAAGVCQRLHACAVCGAGVLFDPRGVKTLQPDNWEILSECSPDRLTELGLAPEEVAAHTPKTVYADISEDIERIRGNLQALATHHADWEENKDSHLQTWQQLDTRLQKVEERLESAPVSEHAPLTNEKTVVAQQMKAIEAKEPSPRHQAHTAHLQVELARREAELAEHLARSGSARSARKSRSVFAYASESTTAEDKSERKYGE